MIKQDNTDLCVSVLMKDFRSVTICNIVLQANGLQQVLEMNNSIIVVISTLVLIRDSLGLPSDSIIPWGWGIIYQLSTTTIILTMLIFFQFDGFNVLLHHKIL